MAAIIEALVSRTFLPMTFTGCGPSCRSTSNTAKSERASPNADTLRDAFPRSPGRPSTTLRARPLLCSLSESPMPIRSGAMQRLVAVSAATCCARDTTRWDCRAVRRWAHLRPPPRTPSRCEELPPLFFVRKCCRDHVAFSYHLKSAWSHYDIHIGSLVVGCKSVGMRIASIPYVAQDVRFSA